MRCRSTVTCHTAAYVWPQHLGIALVSQIRFALRPIVGAASVAVVLGWAGVAQAQGKLEAQYVVSLSGLPVGTGSWFVGIGDDQYSIGANGSTAGLARLFASGSGDT